MPSEQTPLLNGSAGTPLKRNPRFNHWTQHVSSEHGDIALLFCYMITGLLDSAAVTTWGSFVSMQTGNTVYLGSGVVHPNRNDRWLRALISIISFCLGSYAFARFHRYLDGQRRWVIIASYSVQMLLVLVAAVMVQIGPEMSPQGPLTYWVVVPLALVAFQSAGQAVISRVLKFGSLTSVVLTSIYCDLFSDAKLFASLGDNVERNQRAAAPLLLLFGAVLGGLWGEVGISGALWTGVGMKLAVILAWCFWRGEDEDGEEA